MVQINKFIFILISLCVYHAGAQEIQYQSMHSIGNPPEYFLSSSIAKLQMQKWHTSPYKKREERLSQKKFYINGNYWINDLLQSGNVLFGEESHAYLTQVLEYILKSNNINEKVYIHAVKSPVFNAFACDQGMIFVNIGLLARVNNEAELAFVLCHELAHFTHHHNLEGHLKDYENSTKKDANKLTTYEKVVQSHSYSRKMEFAADSIGMHYFKKCGYDFKQASRVFDLMNDENIEFSSFDFNGTLEFSKIKKFANDSLLNNFNVQLDQMIHSNSNDTNFMTHPEPIKRKHRFNQFTPDNSSSPAFIVSQEKFNQLKNSSLKEIAIQYYYQFDFANSFLYASLCNHLNKSENNQLDLARILIMLHIEKQNTLKTTEKTMSDEKNDQSKIFITPTPVFRKLIEYFYFLPDTAIANNISQLITKGLSQNENVQEWKNLNNLYFDWIKKSDFATNYTIPISKVEYTTASKTYERVLFLDPTVMVFDKRQGNILKTEACEEEKEQLISGVRSSFRGSKKFNFLSKSKSKISAQDYNAKSLIMARIQQIAYAESYGIPVSPIWNTKEFESICEKYNSSTALYSFFKSYVSQREINTAKLIMYSTILCPLAALFDSSPSVRTQSMHFKFDLLNGKLVDQYYSEEAGRISSPLNIAKIYFR